MFRTARTRPWINLAPGFVVLAGYVAHAWHYLVYINDDAFITFRYSLFLTLGRGPYFNVGEHVEGYTNFLLMLLMAGGIAVFGTDNALLIARLIGVAGGVLALVAAWALCARWLRKIESVARHADLLAWTAPLLIAVNAAYALNTMSGLETTLFSGWLLLGLWLIQQAHDEQRWRGAGVAFALTRPEGAITFGVVVLAQLLVGAWRRGALRRAFVTDLAIVAAAVVAHLVFRYIMYDGELLPNTYYAKAGGASFRTGAALYIGQFAWYHLGVVAAPVALLPLLARNTEVRRGTAPALFVCLVTVLGLLKTGPDWMLGYRLLVPFAPIWAALAVCGLAAVIDRVRRHALPLACAACAVLASLVTYQGDMPRAYYDHCLTRRQGFLRGHMALADWLNADAKRGDTVALMDIGIVGFLCPNLHILDITGLTDRHIAKSPGEFLRKQYDPAYVLDRRPRYIVITETADSAAPDAPLHPWTPIEAGLVQQRSFVQHYVRTRPSTSADDRLARRAAQAGAERVFEHRYPGRPYFLFVYRYHP
jgi:arabinofuranosyltransferase